MPLPQDASFGGHSPLSKHTLQDLGQYVQKFDSIEADIGRIEKAFSEGIVLPSKANTDLAQLEAKLDKLQCNGVDSIETFQLGSGKDQAKALRKKLTKRAEQLHSKMDDMFQQFKEQMNVDKVKTCDNVHPMVDFGSKLSWGLKSDTQVNECNNGHPLQVMPCSPGRSMCDMCKQVVASTYTYRCQACDYDLCKACFSKPRWCHTFSDERVPHGEEHSSRSTAHPKYPYWTL